MKVRKFICLLSALMITGCATILSGTSQNVSVLAVDAENNRPLEGVVCTLADAKGVYHPIPSNPGTVYT